MRISEITEMFLQLRIIQIDNNNKFSCRDPAQQLVGGLLLPFHTRHPPFYFLFIYLFIYLFPRPILLRLTHRSASELAHRHAGERLLCRQADWLFSQDLCF